MKFPKYNPNGESSLQSYELLKQVFESTQSDAIWNTFSRDQKLAVFGEILKIFAEDNCAVGSADAKACGLPERRDVFSLALSSLPLFTAEEVYEDLEVLLGINDIIENPVVQDYLENQLVEIFKKWGPQALIFLKKAMLEKEFHHTEAEAYRLYSAQLFHLGKTDDFAAQIEEVYLKILSQWEWNHPLVNADAIEALSLRKSPQALPLIAACFAAKLVDEKIIRLNLVKKNYGSLFVEGTPKKTEGAPNLLPPYAGDQNFGRLLHQVAYLDIEQARLMTAAKLVSPTLGRPSELVNEILDSEILFEGDKGYEFCNDAEAKRLIGQIMAFWNKCSRYRQEHLPLVKPPESSTIAFFMRAGLFFYPFLDLLETSSRHFSIQQKAFLRAFRNLDEARSDWEEGQRTEMFSDKDFSVDPKKRYTNKELDQRLLALWDQGYLEFVRGFGA